MAGKSTERKLPRFKRNVETETVEIGGVPVKFWKFKRRWYWGVEDKERIRLPKAASVE
jgi:hypothetical protein